MELDIYGVLKRLPHRYPFLLVDRVVKLEKGHRIEALKNVTINEAPFQGHFPHRPVMPGVLLPEALDVQLVRRRAEVFKFRGSGFVNAELAVEARVAVHKGHRWVAHL